MTPGDRPALATHVGAAGMGLRAGPVGRQATSPVCRVVPRTCGRQNRAQRSHARVVLSCEWVRSDAAWSGPGRCELLGPAAFLGQFAADHLPRGPEFRGDTPQRHHHGQPRVPSRRRRRLRLRGRMRRIGGSRRSATTTTTASNTTTNGQTSALTPLPPGRSPRRRRPRSPPARHRRSTDHACGTAGCRGPRTARRPAGSRPSPPRCRV